MFKNKSSKKGSLRDAIDGALLRAFQKCGYSDIIPRTVRSKAPITTDGLWLKKLSK